MQIIVNGLLAVLKKNTSFEFATENSLFTGSDSYTLAITFPLKDCRQNQAIFGMINRKDAEKENIILDCTIRDKGFFKAGVITITEVGDTEVKAQFLEGRSIQNFEETFDDIYVNELRLGYPSSRNPQNVTPAQAWAAYPTRDEVALPWVNNTSGNMQNEAVFENNAWSWEGNQSLTFQPYLIPLLKKICTVLEYTYDFSELEASEMKYLLICNTLPAAWGAFDYAYALPHWSLTEWFEELENFLFGEFLIDHKKKHIVFHFSKTEIQSKTPVVINKVINAYTVSISLDKECEYIGQKNIRYAENDNRYWAYRDCEWYIKEHKDEAIVYSTLSALLAYAETLKESGVYSGGSRTGNLYTRGYQQGSDGHKLFYAEDVDTYFIMFCYDAELVKTSTFNTVEFHWYKYLNRLEPVNQFGEIEHSKEAPELELKIVPAWIDDTDDDHGQCLFLECGEMGSLYELEEDDQGNTSSNIRPGFGGNRSNADVSATVIDETDYDAGALAQGQAGKMIAKGEQEKSNETFSCLYVGYWDGTNRNTGKSPFPFVHTLVTKNDFTSVSYPYSLSLRRATQYYDRSAIIPIDGKKKYVFSWLSDEIPDVKSEFYIWGKRFLCEKISTTFTEDGRSKLLKGEFYKTVIGVYIVNGIVSDGTNPISGVVVTIGGVSVTTGANGSYSISVRGGDKVISAEKVGYSFDSITINLTGDMRQNIVMTKLNTVSGVVTDGTNPLSGVVVSLGNYSMTTGADGAFMFSDVPEGTYILLATKTGLTMDSITMNVTGDVIQNIVMQLPYDAEISYLKGDGIAYINTGYYPCGTTEIEASGTNQNAWVGLWGMRYASGYNAVGVNKDYIYRYGTAGQAGVSGVYYVGKGVVKKDGVQKATYTPLSTRAAYPIGILCWFDQSSVGSSISKGTFNYMKIWEDDVLVLDLIPVRVGQVGYLYDRVSGNMLGNANSSGAFILGSDI